MKGGTDPCPVVNPLSPDLAIQMIRRIAAQGAVAWTERALDDMRSHRLTTAECHNVLRRGASDPPEQDQVSWRYRIHTPEASVVIAFRSDTELVVLAVVRKPA